VIRAGSVRSGAASRLIVAAVLVTAAVPAAAQLPEDLVFDANILFDNDLGAWGTESGGAGCMGGLYTTTDLGTVKFTRNQLVDPKLNPAAYTLTAPRWDPQAGSPALGRWGATVVRASSFDPWFQDVCYRGAVPFTAGVDANDWTTGWTYYNQAGGAGRTDLDFGKMAVMVTADITSNTTWTSGNNYFLVGRVGVTAGNTLTIEPGTAILGSGVGSYLVIERGARLVANGTRSAPIIFTSGQPLGSMNPGDWGGVVLQGEGSANCSGTMSPGCGLTGGGAQCQSEGGAGVFGGDDDNFDKGSIRYARVEYSGFQIAPNNELNCWTMNAVGKNTVLEYLQADHGSDDGFEWFGGTARCRYLVATSNQDDNLDWQMGYRGFVQFAVVQLNPNFPTDRGIEADNNEFAFNCPLRSNPVFSNLTLVGTGAVAGGTDGVHLRRGTAGVVVNSIIQGFSQRGLRVVNVETFDNCAGAQPPQFGCDVSDARPQTGDFVVSTGRNPTFGPTSISFVLPEAGHVTVRVFDATGRIVDTVADQTFEAGAHTLPWSAADRTAGAYFFRVETGARAASGRILVLR